MDQSRVEVRQCCRIKLLTRHLLEFQAHALDQLLVLGGPEIAQRNVHGDRHHKGQTPAKMTDVHGRFRDVCSERAAESGEGNHNGHDVGNVRLDVPAPVVVVVWIGLVAVV